MVKDNILAVPHPLPDIAVNDVLACDIAPSKSRLTVDDHLIAGYVNWDTLFCRRPHPPCFFRYEMSYQSAIILFFSMLEHPLDTDLMPPLLSMSL